MKTEYTAKDIISNGTMTQTMDNEYFLKDDGTGYSYWHKADIGRGKISLSCSLGHTSYDYCFQCGDKSRMAKVLNRVINKGE